MPSKKQSGLSAAVIGAAATALTVKSAMASGLAPVAQAPVSAATDRLGHVSETAVAASASLLQDAPTTIGKAIVRAPAGPAPHQPPERARPSVGSRSAPAKGERLWLDPEARANPSGSNKQAIARRLLHDAALRHGVDPRLVLAVSYWESGWDQSRVSPTGAVGLMQVEPYMAESAGPSLLGRAVDLRDPYDNADLGVAILKEDLQSYGDPVMALAAYYEGPTALEANGLTADAQQYADGVLALAAQMPS